MIPYLWNGGLGYCDVLHHTTPELHGFSVDVYGERGGDFVDTNPGEQKILQRKRSMYLNLRHKEADAIISHPRKKSPNPNLIPTCLNASRKILLLNIYAFVDSILFEHCSC